MDFTEIILISFGLAMDAFAVSLASGCSGLLGKRATFRLAFHFGLFQFFMPVAGWFAGSKVAVYVADIDHWIAFALLSFLGLRMIRNAIRPEEEEKCGQDPSKGLSLLLLSVATSIDAFAVGFSIAMLSYDIWMPAVIIGIITGILSVIGVKAGKSFKGIKPKYLEITGGVFLIIIGLKILIEHLGILLRI